MAALLSGGMLAVLSPNAAYALEGTADADNNYTVTITDGMNITENVYGNNGNIVADKGYVIGHVQMTGGIVEGNIFGGQGLRGSTSWTDARDAVDNKVYITGGTITGNIYGGYDGSRIDPDMPEEGYPKHEGVAFAICVWHFMENVWIWRMYVYYDTYPLSAYEKWIGADNASVQPLLLYLIMPALCAIPYGRSFYFDVKSGYAAQIISRGKKSDYIRAKYGAAFVSGALIGMIPLVFDFMLTAMVFPMVIPQVGTGTFPVAAMDIMSGVFYTHPLVYNLIFVLIDGCFWGLLNCAVLWAVNFVRSRFWILLTPFIIYIFVFCMVHFVNRVSLSPVMFLRPSAPFRNDIRVVICAFIILIVVNIIFYIHAVKKELVAYE